MKIDNE